MNAVASLAGNKPDKLALRPFPTDRIMLSDAALEPGTYDERIPVQNVLWYSAKSQLVVRIPCDACTDKKVFCNRDGRQCDGCAADGRPCHWSEPKWVPLPPPQKDQAPARAKRPYNKKAKAPPATDDGLSTATTTKSKKTNAVSPSKARASGKDAAQAVGDSDAPSSATNRKNKKSNKKSTAQSEDCVDGSSPSKRKNAADDNIPAAKRRKMEKQEKEAEEKLSRQQITASRKAAAAATPNWEVLPLKAYPYLHRSGGKRPPIWAESRQDLEYILPFYADRSADGVVDGWNMLLLGVDGTAHEEDMWVDGEEGRVLEISFVRKFSKAPLSASEDPTAPHEPAPLGDSVEETMDPVPGPSSLQQLVPCDEFTPTVIQHPPSVPPVPSNIFVPPHVPPPPPACPLLDPPKEMAMLLRLANSRIPLLILCSVASPICPPCAVSDTAVVWLGFFGIERIEEDYPMLPELCNENWVGQKRWRVRMRWCFQENMDGPDAEQPWFGSAQMPRIPVAPELAMDPRRARVNPTQKSHGYPQLAGRAPPSSVDGANSEQTHDEVHHEPAMQLDPALPGVANAVQRSADIGLEGELTSPNVAATVQPRLPERSFVPANFPLVVLPNAVYVNDTRQGVPPKGWCCPCGRLNPRRFLSEWDCECGQSRPIRPLHSRALRPKHEIRSPIPDLEIASHANGHVPPRFEGFDDGSRVLHYPTANAAHVVLHVEQGETDTIFEGLQSAPRFFGRGVPDAKKESAVHFGSQLAERERVKVTAVKAPLLPVPFGFVSPPGSSRAPVPRELRDVRDLMDRALLLCAPDEDGDDVDDSMIPTTAAKYLFGLMWLESTKASRIRLPSAAENLTVLALGANVLLSIPGRARQAPKPRKNLTQLPEDFVVNLFHGDLLVLEALQDGEIMEVKSDGGAMLLICY